MSAEKLFVQYPRTKTSQLSNVSTTIHGGITAIGGRNGAGKSTLLNSIVGLKRIHSGLLSVLGTDLSKRRIRPETFAKIGYLPQDFGFVSTFSALEFVEYGAWLKKVPSRMLGTAAVSALESVGLQNHADIKMGRLSGGMRRRAGIAQAIVHDPALLILDEPTSGLDPEQRVRFRQLIRDLSRDRAVLLSSHLIEDVRALASQVLILEKGALLFQGTPDSLEGLGDATGEGDSPLERGYISILHGNAASPR